jgi:hypothetical protein
LVNFLHLNDKVPRILIAEIQERRNDPMTISSIQGTTSIYSGVSAQETQAASGAQPRAKPAGGMKGKPPAGGAAQSASSTESTSESNKVYDKKDTNKDGTVSSAEELEYKLQHPEESSESSQTTYNQNGKAQSQTGQSGTLLNLQA